ncbi:hypothetical protein SEA_DRYAD_8 [Streptomyces phage Dryad]|nr:hypothetical protein SEA_DRYAD_8 [Streptomyces phage Dryad]
MPALEPELKQAYRELEVAIDRVLRIRGVEGILTEYVTLCGVQNIDDEGDTTGSVMMVLPMGGGLPYHRVMGLLDYTHTVLRAEVARNEMGTNDDDDSG